MRVENLSMLSSSRFVNVFTCQPKFRSTLSAQKDLLSRLSWRVALSYVGAIQLYHPQQTVDRNLVQCLFLPKEIGEEIVFSFQNPRCKVCGGTPLVRSSKHLFLNLTKVIVILIASLSFEFVFNRWCHATQFKIYASLVYKATLRTRPLELSEKNHYVLKKSLKILLKQKYSSLALPVVLFRSALCGVGV